MKKLVLAVVAALCTQSQVQAEGFNGFSVGLSVGASATRIKPNSIFDAKVSFKRSTLERIRVPAEEVNQEVRRELDQENQFMQGGEQDFGQNIEVASSEGSQVGADEYINLTLKELLNGIPERQASAVLENYSKFYNAFKSSKVTFAAAGFIGYTKSFSNNVYTGADLGLTYERLSGNGFKTTNIFGFSVEPRVGYKLNDTTGVYGKLSLGSQYISGEAKKIFYRSVFFITPAVGVEKYLTDKLSLRGEIGYKIQQLKFKEAKIQGVKIRNLKARRNAVTFLVSSVYNF